MMLLLNLLALKKRGDNTRTPGMQLMQPYRINTAAELRVSCYPLQ
jgi:hypothetical protein